MVVSLFQIKSYFQGILPLLEGPYQTRVILPYLIVNSY